MLSQNVAGFRKVTGDFAGVFEGLRPDFADVCRLFGPFSREGVSKGTLDVLGFFGLRKSVV